MTNKSGSLERDVMRSSVMPSLKYSCSRSSLMLVKGNTAIEGLPGNGRAGFCAGGLDLETNGGTNDRCGASKTAATNSASPTGNKIFSQYLPLAGPISPPIRTGAASVSIDSSAVQCLSSLFVFCGRWNGDDSPFGMLTVATKR